MAANTVLRATELNFNTIKRNLATFLRNKPEFTDYDFDGSALSNLLDVLSYNTYYNAIYTNMIANEMFLDSAQIRNNVVARAKMLGYTPRSAKGSQATLNLTITPGTNVATISVPSNTSFTSTIDGIEYNFSTDQTYNLLQENSYTSNTIVIKEGIVIRERATVSTSNNEQRFILSNPNIDLSSLKVQIQSSSSNSSSTRYTQATDLTEVSSNSNIFFIQENEDQKYEIIFGDGVLGSKPSGGNIVITDYRVVNGSLPNGANNFTGPGAIAGYNSYTVTVANSASLGSNNESVESIKFNAPKSFERQGRAVIKNDYSRLLLAEAPDLQAVSVWGGEQNDPPIYGRVYIACKPKEGNLLSDQRKTELKTLLQTRNIVTIEPVFVDATFLYIVPSITVRYNAGATTLVAGQISNKVTTAINNFETTELSLFDKKFRESTFVKKITESDPAILGTNSTYRIMKRFTPNQNVSTSYNLAYNNPISNPHGGHKGAVSSTSFTHQGETSFLDDDGNGNVRIFYLGDNNIAQYTNNTAGTVNYSTGLVSLNNINIESNSTVEVSVKPSINDIITVRNNILLLSGANIDVVNDSTGVIESSVKNVTTTGTTTTITTSYTGTTQTGTTSGVSGSYY